MSQSARNRTPIGIQLGPLFAHRREPVERAGHAADRRIVEAGVKRGGIELGVAEQHLDEVDVGVLFQEVRGDAVPQCVWRDALLDRGSLGGGVNGAVDARRLHPALPLMQLEAVQIFRPRCRASGR